MKPDIQEIIRDVQGNHRLSCIINKKHRIVLHALHYVSKKGPNDILAIQCLQSVRIWSYYCL